jgi:outer membrane protein OmpA-like peptidoglycan-associated protein
LNFKTAILLLHLPFCVFAQEKSPVSEYKDSIYIDTFYVKIIHPDTTINSRYSDFGAVKPNESELYFTSIRPDADEKTETFIPVNYISRIYISKISKDSYSPAGLLSSKINSIGADNGDISFSADNKRIYFSRLDLSGKNPAKTSIYTSVFKNGRWHKPRRLGGKVNPEGYSTSQPSVAPGHNGGEILYFVSDRPGGLGKKDIWYTEISPDGGCSEPVNLGYSINTEADEATPFFDQKTQTLYFSSDGHKGFGGLDIFKSIGSRTTWLVPENLGEQYNTKYHEMFFTVNPADSGGYFTSNRNGSFFLADDSCCFDIYEYKILKGEKIKKIIVRRDTLKQYYAHKDTQTEPDEPKKTTNEKHSERTNKPDTVQKHIAKEFDVREAENRKPYQPPAFKGSTLNLELYFDNDYPDRHSHKVYTDFNYTSLLKDYISKRNEFINGYAYCQPPDEKQKGQSDVSRFFETKVLTADTALENFTSRLLALLSSGSEVTLRISGFCSPLFTNPYNINLSERRISALIVHLCHYRNGELIKYFHPATPGLGHLVFILNPTGENNAPASVSDNPQDLCRSVYSPDASMERKITITASIEK